MRKILNLAHYFPYDVKLRLLAHSQSFLANQKARNAIVGAENLLNEYSTTDCFGFIREMCLFSLVVLVADGLPSLSASAGYFFPLAFCRLLVFSKSLTHGFISWRLVVVRRFGALFSVAVGWRKCLS